MANTNGTKNGNGDGAKNGPVYHYRNSEGKENLYVDLTDRCTNKCLFCDIDYLSKEVGHNLRNPGKIDVDEIVRDIVLASMKYSANPKGTHELVFCGAGEPMLEFENMIQIAKKYQKNTFSFLPIRLNTNGHGLLIHQTSAANRVYDIKLNEPITGVLVDAGIKKVNVSMNVASVSDGKFSLEDTAKMYASVCKPDQSMLSQKMTDINPLLIFEYVYAFAKACANNEEIDTGISFIDNYVAREGAEIALKYLGLDKKVRLLMRHASNLDKNNGNSSRKTN